MNYNKVIIAGNLVRDPEVVHTPKGTPLLNTTIAINRKWKDNCGEDREEVAFVEVKAFGKTAEVIGQYFRKGRPIFLEGRLHQETWDEKDTGKKRSKLIVNVDSFQFVEKKANGNGNGDAPKRVVGETPASQTQPGETDEVPF